MGPNYFFPWSRSLRDCNPPLLWAHEESNEGPSWALQACVLQTDCRDSLLAIGKILIDPLKETRTDLILQTIFSILIGHDVIKASSTFSYDDLLYGLPSLLTCCEMVILSLGFWYAYSSTEYASSKKPMQPRMALWKAVLDAMNPWDLLVGIARVFGIITHLRKTGGFEAWGQARAQAKSDKRAKTVQRRAQGRYQTLDGMESLSRPDAAHGTRPEDPSYPMMYQPPSGSPPKYDAPTKNHLVPETRTTRSSSPSGRTWDGRRYDRTPSPSGRFVESTDMV